MKVIDLSLAKMIISFTSFLQVYQVLAKLIIKT